MRMIASILDCPFRLSIFPADPEEEEKLKEGAIAGAQKSYKKRRAEDEEGYQHRLVFDEETDAKTRTSKETLKNEAPKEILQEDERDMTIGELYEIHEELTELEEESAEEFIEEAEEPREIKGAGKRMEKDPAKEENENAHSGGIFLRRAHRGDEVKRPETRAAEPRKPAREVITPDSEDFEPVIKYDDLEEDLSIGEMNPYTGREYQTNSVRMHPSRIGYVQVYDRKLHQWTDMTEWAFLGYQERKKALLGKEYEPPIYLD